MSKFLSREFVIAFIGAVVGIVRMFTAVDDALVEQVTGAAVAAVSVLAYVLARTSQKKKGV